MKNDTSLQIDHADEVEGRVFIVEYGCQVLCGGNIDMPEDMGYVSHCFFQKRS